MNKAVFLGFFALCGLLVLPTFAFAQSYYYPYQNSYYDNTYYNNAYNYGDDVVCVPEYQTVEEGQTAYFFAYGGDGDYNWEAEGRSYNNRGRAFSHVFDDRGTERVDVESDGESDTCRVNVVSRSYYTPYPPTYPTYPTYPQQPVNIISTYVPQALPNTGFPPISSAAIAFAAVLLFGVGLALTPYAKKIVTAIR